MNCYIQFQFQDEEEVVSFFTNIPIEEAINYILLTKFMFIKVEPICSQLIFRRLLIKLAMKCTFKFNSRFLN